MSTFKLIVITPEKEIFNGEVQKMFLRTVNGDVGILAKHVNYVTKVDIGMVKLFFEDGKEDYISVSEGILKVGQDKTVIMVSTAEWKRDIDISRANKAKEKAEKILKSAQSKKDAIIAELGIKRALNRINIAKK